jgi:GNAT superfamily N-acetyltransferase
MKYDKFLLDLKSRISIPGGVFNPLKFKEQFFQSVYIIEDYINILYDKKIFLADLFAGIGTYALFFAEHNKLIKEVIATEKNEKAFQILNEAINYFTKKNLIIPYKIDNNARYNPFKNKYIKSLKFDVIVANPPYVPVPEGVNIANWADGGKLGISAIIELFKNINKFTQNKALFGCLSYSIGSKRIENSSLVIGNFKSKIKNEELEKEKIYYQEIFNDNLDRWKVIFFELRPPAWVGYKKELNCPIIALNDYYKLVQKKKREEIKAFCYNFPKNERYLSNIFIVGLKNSKCRTRYIIKTIGEEYLREVMDIEKKCWPEYLQASKDNIKSRLRYFPEGTVGVFNTFSKMLGFATSQIIKFEPKSTLGYLPIEKWMELDYCKNANILNTSDFKGNALHLVSACVLPEFRGMGIWKDMIIYRLRLAKLLGLKYAVIISRLRATNREMYVADLFKYIASGNDPNICLLKRFGFRVNGMIKKDEDKESLGHWVLMYKEI